MNRGELVDRITADTNLLKKDVSAVLSAFEAAVVSSVASGDKVQLAGFATFDKADRSAREARNPRTGDIVKIPATVVPRIKAGKGFKDAMIS